MRKAIAIVLFIVVIVMKVEAQNLDGSINWGNTGGLNGDMRVSTGLVNDPNWGVLPSSQNRNVDMWGNTRNTNQNVQRRTIVRDAMGNLLLTDANGNVLTDANGVPMIDSVALNLGLSLDPDPAVQSVPPPPDDPQDIPLDGGVILLLAFAIGWNYKFRKLVF